MPRTPEQDAAAQKARDYLHITARAAGAEPGLVAALEASIDLDVDAGLVPGVYIMDQAGAVLPFSVAEERAWIKANADRYDRTLLQI